MRAFFKCSLLIAAHKSFVVKSPIVFRQCHSEGKINLFMNRKSRNYKVFERKATLLTKRQVVSQYCLFPLSPFSTFWQKVQSTIRLGQPAPLLSSVGDGVWWGRGQIGVESLCIGAGQNGVESGLFCGGTQKALGGVICYCGVGAEGKGVRQLNEEGKTGEKGKESRQAQC